LDVLDCANFAKESVSSLFTPGKINIIAIQLDISKEYFQEVVFKMKTKMGHHFHHYIHAIILNQILKLILMVLKKLGNKF
jgi:hypothetical protein